MIQFFKNNKSILWKCIVLLSMVLLLVTFNLLRLSSDISEWWQTHFGRWYVTVNGYIHKYIPFSMTELFYLCTISFAIFLVVLSIKDLKHKRRVEAVSKLITIPMILMCTITSYFFACGFGYNRKPVDLPFYETQVENEEFDEIYNYFMDDMNACISELEFKENGDLKLGLNFQDLSKRVGNAYKNLNSNYYNSISTYAKPMVTSFIYRELQITGVSFSALGEANVNYLATDLELPFTIAHEIAHIKGVMREDDANQVAFYVLLNSDDPLLKMSAYGLYMYQIRNLTKNNLMTQAQIDSLHRYDNHYAYAVNHMIDYWKKHNLLQKIGDFFNDLSIKSNGIKEGTDSYEGGTEQEIVPGTGKLIPSKYQQLFFDYYYRNK